MINTQEPVVSNVSTLNMWLQTWFDGLLQNFSIKKINDQSKIIFSKIKLDMLIQVLWAEGQYYMFNFTELMRILYDKSSKH